MSKTIVMIHGMWGGAWYWENFRYFFEAKGYRCHTPLLRYHDVDPQDPPNPNLGTVSLLDYADDLESYIHSLDEKPILFGHSMGGLLAQILGARGLAERLVLLTPASPRGINALTVSVIRSFWDVITRWRFWRNPHRLTLNAAVYAMMHLLSPDDQRAVHERMVHESGRAAFEIGFWYMDPKSASRVDESKMACPVLVVAGSKDRITPASVVQKVARKYQPVSTYKAFDNHAHWIMGEPGWQAVAEFIDGWMGSV